MKLILVASRSVRDWVVSCVGALALSTLSLAAWAQLAVGQDGQPDYQHPIAVPPGIAGMVPNNVTTSELNSILKSESLLNKTTFYRDGKIVPASR